MTALCLETARLRLRPARADDGDALFAAFGDVELMRYWSSPAHRDAAETRAHIAARTQDQGGNAMLAVTRIDHDAALGFVSIMPRRPAVFEIGYMFVRAVWGQGIAREAVGCVIDHLFDDRGARRVFADTDPDNAGSIALLERLGFIREGYLREEWETHIGVRDTALYGLIRRDWARSR